MARGDLPTAFQEAGHVVAAWSRGLRTHSATIIPTPEFRGHVMHGNPWHGIRRNAALAGVRYRAECAIIVRLAGPEAQRRHSPRSWRSHHGSADFEHAVDVATGLNGSEEAALAYLDWLAIVTATRSRRCGRRSRRLRTHSSPGGL